MIEGAEVVQWRGVAAIALIVSGPATHAGPPQWEYSTRADAMTSQPIRIAATRSVGVLQFSAPYGGPQRATLAVRYHPREGTNVMLAIESGQFVCGLRACRLPVRFDDAPAVAFDALEPTDGSSTQLFIQPVGRFLQLLRASHRVIIEATFFQEGSRAIEFATQGLEWESTHEERAYSTASKIAAARRAAFARCRPSPNSPPTSDCIDQVGDCVRDYEWPGLSTSGNLATALKCLDAVGRR
jgi:hypothetical protein